MHFAADCEAGSVGRDILYASRAFGSCVFHTCAALTVLSSEVWVRRLTACATFCVCLQFVDTYAYYKKALGSTIQQELTKEELKNSSKFRKLVNSEGKFDVHTLEFKEYIFSLEFWSVHSHEFSACYTLHTLSFLACMISDAEVVPNGAINIRTSDVDV